MGYVDREGTPRGLPSVRELLTERYGELGELERERRWVRANGMRDPADSGLEPEPAGIGEVRLSWLAAALAGEDPRSRPRDEAGAELAPEPLTGELRLARLAAALAGEDPRRRRPADG